MTRTTGRLKTMSYNRAYYVWQDRRQKGGTEEGESYTDQFWIERAMGIVGRLNNWARRTHTHRRWRGMERRMTCWKMEWKIG